MPEVVSLSTMPMAGALRLSDVKDPLARVQADKLLQVVARREPQIGEDQVLILQQLILMEFIRGL
jgi:hypothetical protein